MPMQEEAVNSASLGEPSQPERPCSDPSNRERNRSERNFVQSSCFTMEEFQRVVGTLGELAKKLPSLTENMENKVKELEQRMSSFDNWVHKLVEKKELANNHSPHVGRANATGENDARKLRLQIQPEVSDPLFTGKELKGKGGACIYVSLIDATTGDVVRSGPESSIKLDIVVLKGGFNKDDEDDWTKEEFEKQMVKKRKKKGLLLQGKPQVTVKEGVGVLEKVIFKDNSRWETSENFRIGLKVALGYCENTRIREGKTNAFRVKEGRGEPNMKHHPPELGDEVWRLETICKDGPRCKRLSNAEIYTVKDFLLQEYKNARDLRAVLGDRETSKRWQRLVEHAKTCRNWNPPVNHSNGMKHAASFNTDHQLTGLTEDMNHEDTIGKASSSFPSQVSEQQTENPAPVQHNMARSTCAPPVGPDAPLANADSTAHGHNDVTGLQSSIESLGTMKDPANAARPLRLLRRVHQASDLFSRREIGSSSQMGCTSNENVFPPMSQQASMSSKPDGPPTESPSPFPYENLPDATRRRMFNDYEKMGCPVNELDHSSKALHAFSTEDDHMTKDLPSNAEEDPTIFADLPNVLPSDASTRGGGFFQAPEKEPWLAQGEGSDAVGFLPQEEGSELCSLMGSPIQVQGFQLPHRSSS